MSDETINTTAHHRQPFSSKPAIFPTIDITCMHLDQYHLIQDSNTDKQSSLSSTVGAPDLEQNSTKCSLGYDDAKSTEWTSISSALKETDTLALAKNCFTLTSNAVHYTTDLKPKPIMPLENSNFKIFQNISNVSPVLCKARKLASFNMSNNRQKLIEQKPGTEDSAPKSGMDSVSSGLRPLLPKPVVDTWPTLWPCSRIFNMNTPENKISSFIQDELDSSHNFLNEIKVEKNAASDQCLIPNIMSEDRHQESKCMSTSVKHKSVSHNFASQDVEGNYPIKDTYIKSFISFDLQSEANIEEGDTRKQTYGKEGSDNIESLQLNTNTEQSKSFFQPILADIMTNDEKSKNECDSLAPDVTTCTTILSNMKCKYGVMAKRRREDVVDIGNEKKRHMSEYVMDTEQRCKMESQVKTEADHSEEDQGETEDLSSIFPLLYSYALNEGPTSLDEDTNFAEDYDETISGTISSRQRFDAHDDESIDAGVSDRQRSLPIQVPSGGSHTKQVKDSFLAEFSPPKHGYHLTPESSSQSVDRSYLAFQELSSSDGGGSSIFGIDFLTSGRDTATFGRNSPMSERHTPTFDRQSPISERETPIYGKESPIHGWGMTNFRREFQISSKDTSIFGRESPLSGKETWSFEEENYDAEKPIHGRESPTSDKKTSYLEKELSNWTLKKKNLPSSRNFPVFGNGSPRSGKESPISDPESPISGRESPISDSDTPASRRESPTSVQETVKSERESPMFGRRQRKPVTPSRSPEPEEPGFRGVTLRMRTSVESGNCQLSIKAFFSTKKVRHPARLLNGRSRNALKGAHSPALTEGYSSTDSEDIVEAPKEHKRRSYAGKQCMSCGTKKTPLWRDAEDGTSLCNACGIRYKKYRVRCVQCWHIPRKDTKTNPNCTRCGELLKCSFIRNKGWTP